VGHLLDSASPGRLEPEHHHDGDDGEHDHPEHWWERLIHELSEVVGGHSHDAAEQIDDALEADTIILAVPFGEHREVAKLLPSWEGKTIIDATGVSPPVPYLALDPTTSKPAGAPK